MGVPTIKVELYKYIQTKISLLKIQYLSCSSLRYISSWAIGLSVATIVQAVMSNNRNVFALSTNVKVNFNNLIMLNNFFNSQGIHGIEEDLFLSLPTVLGANGINFIIRQELKPHELEQLRESARKIHDIQQSLKLKL
jgi:L-lactate dehydrogenase